MDRIQKGDVVVHFKNEYMKDEKYHYYYHYFVKDFGIYTETNEKCVIYQSLYSDPDNNIHFGDYFIRPYDMFMSKVDKEKYPDIKQEYRFEKVILKE